MATRRTCAAAAAAIGLISAHASASAKAPSAVSAHEAFSRIDGRFTKARKRRAGGAGASMIAPENWRTGDVADVANVTSVKIYDRLPDSMMKVVAVKNIGENNPYHTISSDSMIVRYDML